MPRSLESESPLIGTWLDGRFWIEGHLATGGFGAVYRARTASGLPVALKLLHRQLLGDPAAVARFQREGTILTQLHDRHTVTTLAVGETGDGTPYIAMELLAGESLHARLARERTLPWRTAAAIARAVCCSLAEAHALGVVHRDLKPANIQIGDQGGAAWVKVIDFGIGKVTRGSAIDDGQELTHLGHLIGTMDYMSPEQLIDGACSAASDLYALGVVLYEMLTGRRPFAESATLAAMLTALVTESPRAPSELVALPPALDRVVLRCLERDPLLRFTTAHELAAALDGVLAASDPVVAAPRRAAPVPTTFPTLRGVAVAHSPRGERHEPSVGSAADIAPTQPRSAPVRARPRRSRHVQLRLPLVLLCATAVLLAGIAGYLFARI